MLPLKYDKDEGIIQHEFLVDLVLQMPDKVYSNSN